MICIIIATRSGATEFSGPMKLLKEMYSKASKDYLFEIVIRGDEDDKFFPKTVKDIKLAKFPFRIKFITGKRGRGYEDLHKFYNECLIESSGSQKIIFSLPEDVVINFNEWDKYIIKQYNLAKERFGHSYFTMHESTLPGICDNYEGTVESPDSFPIYSFDWMLCTGGFAHTGSNDSWVQVTHHMLLKKFGVHCRYFLPKRIFQRHTDSHDGISSRRWVNSRLRNHDLLRNKKVSMIINNHAKIIYQNIVFNTQNLSKNLNDVVYVQL
ncbi:MAG: hypothetical protein HRT87_08910, partial [Legionellales bacterium]|nr:hypothetical protein [Legionellales bacterium]